MQPSKTIEYVVSESDDGKRLDKFLNAHLKDFSRTYIQKLIENNYITVEDVAVKPSYAVAAGEKVLVSVPPPRQTEIIAENIELDIIYEDHALLVINKPPGMVVHPGAGIRSGTLVNALLHHCKDLSGVGGRLRPGIVHRLDKNTSGLLVVAKNDMAHLHLSRQFSEKKATREYSALVWHTFNEDQGKIETFLNRSKRDRKLFTVADTGKKAITHYQVERTFNFLTFLKLYLKTGRTHQIRIHLNHIHHPVFGDPEYHGRLKQINQLSKQADRQFAKKLLGKIQRQALHAKTLGFVHPVQDKWMSFEAPEPDDFHTVLDKLKKSAESQL